jgi:mRNA-degrading endonuclease toxin of MazEF toxin-antitoxin module
VHWARLDKRRPVLVVSPDYRNDWANDVVVVPLSTVRRAAPTHVFLKRGEAGLGTPSVAKCEQVVTIPSVDLEPDALGGLLGWERMDEVERALLRALGIEPGALERHLTALRDWDPDAT